VFKGPEARHTYRSKEANADRGRSINITDREEMMSTADPEDSTVL
jgi:hypothetical protein